MAAGTTPRTGMPSSGLWISSASAVLTSHSITVAINSLLCICSLLPVPLRRGQERPGNAPCCLFLGGESRRKALDAAERRLCRRAIELEHKHSTGSSPSLGWPGNCTGGGGSCCILKLPLGKCWGNILRLIIPILTQTLDCWVRVAGCCRRNSRYRGNSSSSATLVLLFLITCKTGLGDSESHFASVEGTAIATGVIKSLESD